MTTKRTTPAHTKIKHGLCPTCGHYGEDCTGSAPPPEQKRFRVYLLEKLHYTVDVLAKDEEEARELALDDETPRSEAECTFFDAEEIAVIPEDDKTFLPANGCYRCGVRVDDDGYPHCGSCIQFIKQTYGKAA